MTNRLAFTIQEVADMVGVSEKTIDREIAGGKIAFFRVGKKAVRIARHSIDAYMKEREERKSE